MQNQSEHLMIQEYPRFLVRNPEYLLNIKWELTRMYMTWPQKYFLHVVCKLTWKSELMPIR